MENEENEQRPAQTEGKTRIPGWFVAVMFIIFSLSNIMVYYGTKTSTRKEIHKEYVDQMNEIMIERNAAVDGYNHILPAITECMNMIIYMQDEGCITLDSTQTIELKRRRDLASVYMDSSVVDIQPIIDDARK